MAKWISLALITVIFGCGKDYLLNTSTGTFTDSIDNTKYNWVQIGEQIWMAENLAYLPLVNRSEDTSEILPCYYVYGFEGNDTLKARGSSKYSTYGALYNWVAAKTACPPGWHLASADEWVVLTDYLNSMTDYQGTDAAKRLKSTSGWPENGNGDNSSGFNAIPGGTRGMSYDGNRGYFSGLGTCAYFWTSSLEEGNWYALNFHLYGTKDRVHQFSPEEYGFSVRCIKNDPDRVNAAPSASFVISPTDGYTITLFEFDANGCTDDQTSINRLQIRWDWNNDGNWDTEYSPTKIVTHRFSQPGTYTVKLEVKDGEGLAATSTQNIVVVSGTGSGSFTDSRDGRPYNYASIGTQTWMTENLQYLPSVSGPTRESGTSPYYYVYGFEGTSIVQAKLNPNFLKFGVLYNWPAAMNGASSSNSVPSRVQGICPDGWHLPSDAEWGILINYLGGEIIAGQKLKSLTGWNSSGNGDNSSGFNALPGGNRYMMSFDGQGDFSNFWSSTTVSPVSAWNLNLDRSPGATLNNSYNDAGYSMRCLRNGG